jgi:hypothetical protein
VAVPESVDIRIEEQESQCRRLSPKSEMLFWHSSEQPAQIGTPRQAKQTVSHGGIRQELAARELAAPGTDSARGCASRISAVALIFESNATPRCQGV